MDFDLPETALAVRDGVAAVAAKYDHAYWSRCEEEHRFPTRSSTTSPPAAGSACACPSSRRRRSGPARAGRGQRATVRFGGTAGTVSYITTPGFGAMTLARHGSEEQKQRILPGLAEATLKLKRRVVHQKYADVLDRLYS